MDRLFDPDLYERLSEERDTGLNRGARAGSISEHLAIAELLKRRHKVAVPVVDDGIDLVVDYRTTVQVKSSGTTQGGSSWSFPIGTGKYAANGEKRYRRILDADVFIFHAVRVDAWWIIPTRWLHEAGIGESMGISLLTNPGTSKYGALSRSGRDAWDLLKQDWA